MASYNKVLLMGNLTRDPELRYTSNNQAVANFGLAVNRRFTTSNGEQREETTFVDCEAWGRQGEVISQYLSKGRPIFIEGRLRLDQWQDQQGQNRSRLKVVVEGFQFIDSRGGGGDSSDDGSGSPRRTASPGGAGGRSSGGSYEPVEDDEIPF
jgi:single-strand DNA-binding protein